MTTFINTEPQAPLWLRELASARTSYEERLGWPVGMEVSQRRLVVRVGPSIGAITMPAATGEKVLTQLRMMLMEGPVLASPGDRWTFLTVASANDRPEMPAVLRAAHVDSVERGCAVELPTSLHGAGWVAQPRHFLPPWATVVGTARRVLGS